MIFFTLSMLLVVAILSLFFFASKNIAWEIGGTSSFECGFSSYFFCRYSFSMHYFMIGLIFLFLDLELCFLMPFFIKEFSSVTNYFISSIFVLILILGILFEWKEGKLEWKF